jgi:hypothetical protein
LQLHSVHFAMLVWKWKYLSKWTNVSGMGSTIVREWWRKLVIRFTISLYSCCCSSQNWLGKGTLVCVILNTNLWKLCHCVVLKQMYMIAAFMKFLCLQAYVIFIWIFSTRSAAFYWKGWYNCTGEPWGEESNASRSI